jgi:two-component system, LytTR family, sensor histidine kinase AgrC
MREVGYVFYVYIVDFIKLWIFLWGIMNFVPVPKKKRYLFTGAIQSVLLMIAGRFYKDNTDLFTILLIVMVVFTVCFLLDGNFLKKLAYALLAYVFILLIDACVAGMINMAGRKLLYDESLRLVCNMTDLILLSIFALIKRNRRKTTFQVSISKKIYALLFTGAGTGSFVLTALLIESNSKTTENARRAMIIVTIIIVAAYCGACLMMIFITESRDNYKTLSLINQSIIESQQQYYLLVHEKQQEMRSIRHEMRNHLSCIRGLYKAEKLSEMEQYINQLIEASDLTDDLFETGNDIVNAILNDVQNRCRKDHIVIRLTGGFPANLIIAPMDLCIIFANTITNAVEAIQRMDREEGVINYIDVKISSFKDDLYIDVINPVGKKVELYNGKLLTSKKDKSVHGFGVKNVIQRVEKYYGAVNYRSENNQFFAEINLKNKV